MQGREGDRRGGVMGTLSSTEFETLEAFLACLRQQAFTGVLVGVGSVILHFGRCYLTVQCPFEVTDGAISKTGHGEAYETSPILFDFLNHTVVDTHADPTGQIALTFSEQRVIKIIPALTGFESYVLGTPKGLYPMNLGGSQVIFDAWTASSASSTKVR
jgi:hypothetical protein